MCVVVVKGVVREVDRDCSCVFVGHGTDEEAGAEEVLVFEGEGGRVLRVDVEHGVHERGAVCCLAP